VFFIPHDSRQEKNEKGEMILYEDQDETLWDQELIAKGTYHLHQAAQGESNFKISSRSDHRLLEHSEIRTAKEKWENSCNCTTGFCSLNIRPWRP
jgi:RNA polymerase sigma-70 factor (ECF subfamily)